jgi:hypothetical protein
MGDVPVALWPQSTPFAKHLVGGACRVVGDPLGLVVDLGDHPAAALAVVDDLRFAVRLDVAFGDRLERRVDVIDARVIEAVGSVVRVVGHRADAVGGLEVLAQARLDRLAQRAHQQRRAVVDLLAVVDPPLVVHRAVP